MIVDAKIDYKNGKLVLIHDDGTVETSDAVPPYFYVIVEESKVKVLKAVLHGENIWLESDSRLPVVYRGDRYRVDTGFKVLRVYTNSPTDVPRISSVLVERGFRVSASNVRYVIRNTFDHHVRFFDAIPLYYGFDSELNRKITKVKGAVIDVEAVEGKPILASAYEYSPFTEVQKDNVASFKLPEEADELYKFMNRYSIIYGHNILGFDIPVLERAGLVVNRMVKLLFDTSIVLSTYGSSLGVGSARSLLDVATIMKEEVGITDAELDIKRRVKGRVDRLGWEELVKYNVNDVVLTCKILDSIAPFIFSVSAVTQIPPSEVITLPSGMIAEYSLLRYMELEGYIPEYRPSNARLTGERVYLASQGKTYRNIVHLDIKAMYPSFVLANKVDPTLHVGGGKFSRDAGEGFLYGFVKRLFNLRLTVRSLKKKDSRFEPVDKGLKAILNALAFGVQGKTSGLAIMGNPWCPERIFYGTRDIQFGTIEYLKGKGLTVVYGDTDSFFILSGGKKPEEIVKAVNEYLSKYGLEADVEEVWDSMYIYSKKNYIVRKGDKVIIKGSALHNLERFYLPEAVSLHQLVKLDSREERLRYVREVIWSCDVEDLFFRGHQQVWRLFGKDLQSWKRLKERRERYILASTPWNEKPLIVLKKSHLSQFLMPHSAPLFSFFLDGSEEIEIAELNPFNIVELRTIRLEDEYSCFKAKYGLYDLMVYTDSTYLIKVKDMRYGLRFGDKVRYLPTQYSWRQTGLLRPLFERFRCTLKVRKVNVDEETLRRVTFDYCKSTLSRYGFI